MTKVDVVLISSSGVEISRKTTTSEKDIYSIIKNWVLIPGDTIKIEECQQEE